MGFLSKLFGDAGEELTPVLDKLKDFAGTVASEVNDAATEVANAVNNEFSDAKKAFKSSTAGESSPAPSETCSGPVSWGEQIPAEENQYNFGGTYDQYFDHVFQLDFPAYKIEKESIRYGYATLFTFYKDSKKALVVELMSQNSSIQRIREACQKEGTPYLRFYYNHEGWWNTRSYVTARTKKALGE